MRRIASEIRASLDFHAGQPEGGREVDRVVLTGPAMAVAGFGPALAGELELEVVERTVQSSDAMKLSTLDVASLSVAAGLALETGLMP